MKKKIIITFCLLLFVGAAGLGVKTVMDKKTSKTENEKHSEMKIPMNENTSTDDMNIQQGTNEVFEVKDSKVYTSSTTDKPMTGDIPTNVEELLKTLDAPKEMEGGYSFTGVDNSYIMVNRSNDGKTHRVYPRYIEEQNCFLFSGKSNGVPSFSLFVHDYSDYGNFAYDMFTNCIYELRLANGELNVEEEKKWEMQDMIVTFDGSLYNSAKGNEGPSYSISEIPTPDANLKPKDGSEEENKVVLETIPNSVDELSKFIRLKFKDSSEPIISADRENNIYIMSLKSGRGHTYIPSYNAEQGVFNFVNATSEEVIEDMTLKVSDFKTVNEFTGALTTVLRMEYDNETNKDK